VVTGLDRVVEVAAVEVGVGPRDGLGGRGIQVQVALAGAEVVLDPELLTGRR
jgi:hypothetical protein